MAIKNVPGVGTLLGMLAGGTLSAATSEEDENLIEDTATSAFMAGAGATALGPVARQVAAFSGRRMDNFSEGAYDAEAIKPKTIAGKAAALVTKSPMHVSTAENWGQNVPSQKHTWKKLEETIAKNWDEKPLYGPQHERNPHYEYDRYKNWGPNNRNFNATPEEYRWKVEWDARKKLADKLDADIIRRDNLIAMETDPARKARWIEQQRKAIYAYKRAGEANRKWRHEIAKNEVQALTWGKKWSRTRMREAGYAYKGMYQWGDVKKFLPSGTVNAWENSMKLVGIDRKFANDRTIPVLMNIHRGDKQIVGKMASRDSRWLQRASYRIANYDIENVSQLNKWLKLELVNDPRFNLSKREVTAINQWWKDLPDAQKKLYGALEDPLEKYAAKMSRGIQQAGAFRTNAKTGLRGYFNMGAAKNLGVSTLYLEGGINANVELKPFIQGNKLQVASRIVKTDIQDLAKSAELGLQRRPPIIINQSFQTYKPERVINPNVPEHLKQLRKDHVLRRGEVVRFSPEGTIGRNVTKANPYYGKYNWDMDLLGKQLERGKVRDLWQSDTSLKKKIKGTTKAIKKNPRKALKYATRAPLGKAIKAVAIGGAAITGLKAMSNDDEDGYPFK